MDERYMYTEDRVEQVNALREQARILADYGTREDGDGEARVAFWEQQSEELPEWYDAHDRKLLVEWTDKNLG
jgi:hypothetical protein